MVMVYDVGSVPRFKHVIIGFIMQNVIWNWLIKRYVLPWFCEVIAWAERLGRVTTVLLLVVTNIGVASVVEP